MTGKHAVGLNVRAEASGRSQILGLLLRDSVIEVGERSTDRKWARIAKVVEVGIDSVRSDGSVPPEAASGWVFLAELDPEPTPVAFDEVVVLDEPHVVKQGDVLGYLGEDVPSRANPIANQPVSRRLLHLEVISGDDVPAYLAASRQWAGATLGDKECTLLLLRPGDTLHIDPNGAVACTLNWAQVLPLSTLESKEVDGQRWRKVKGLMLDNGRMGEGWAKEAGRLASPWEWPGFDVVDELASSGGGVFEDVAAWAGFIKKERPRPEETPFYNQLRRMLDTNHDGLVSEQELDAALRDRSKAAHMARIIVRHDSAWAKEPAVRQRNVMTRIAELLGPGAAEQVEAEAPRAGKLPWWDEVASGVDGFPNGPRVYHFHPGGLAGLFLALTGSDCAERFKKISPVILRHEGGFVNDPADPGGATNMGIAWPTWKSYALSDLGLEPSLENLKSLKREQAEVIYLKRYWEPKGFCTIENLRTALMIYDWTITSGKAVREVQIVLAEEFSKNVPINNSMGKRTIDAINSVEDQGFLVERIAVARKRYYTALTVDKDGRSNAKVKFLKGWHNRVDDCLRVSP